MRQIIGLLILCLALGSFQSCVSKKKFDELQAAKDATDKALAETQAQLKTLQDQNAELQATLESEKNRLNGEIASIKNDLNNTKTQMAQVQDKLKMTEAELKKIKDEINGIFGTYAESGLKLEERDGRLYVMTDAEAQYKTGSASLTRAEKAAIAELATTLKNNPKLRILIEGHTDNKQYAAGASYDNWSLSVDRAMSVARELLKKGASPNQVAVVGRGDTMPAADNSTADGRTKNRRAIVAPDPNLSQFLKSGGN
ncbi:MAG: OmpA family protein [Saprospiraceae bacterium]|nr:OmpA family protein [Saprospiraceae bacterium]